MQELDDRWILPLRGRSVIGIDWRASDLLLDLGNEHSILVGYGAHLTPGNGKADDPNFKPLTEWDRKVADEALRSSIVSSVGFKSGTLRIRFNNGWGLVARPIYKNSSAIVYAEGRVLWQQTAVGGTV
ncbi:DUF6188 family protein [Nocardia sp. NPDC060259]|uniref:DUF6188 family protein n=1 Tax=Nocardia sp. NPDC060259 TaxID=3347088 RepID=UPI003658D476